MSFASSLISSLAYFPFSFAFIVHFLLTHLFVLYFLFVQETFLFYYTIILTVIKIQAGHLYIGKNSLESRISSVRLCFSSGEVA